MISSHTMLDEINFWDKISHFPDPFFFFVSNFSHREYPSIHYGKVNLENAINFNFDQTRRKRREMAETQKDFWLAH